MTHRTCQQMALCTPIQLHHSVTCQIEGRQDGEKSLARLDTRRLLLASLRDTGVFTGEPPSPANVKERIRKACNFWGLIHASFCLTDILSETNGVFMSPRTHVWTRDVTAKLRTFVRDRRLSRVCSNVENSSRHKICINYSSKILLMEVYASYLVKKKVRKITCSLFTQNIFTQNKVHAVARKPTDRLTTNSVAMLSDSPM
jgi:hypothetical protein